MMLWGEEEMYARWEVDKKVGYYRGVHGTENHWRIRRNWGMGRWIPVGFLKTSPRIKVHIPQFHPTPNKSEPAALVVCPVDAHFKIRRPWFFGTQKFENHWSKLETMGRPEALKNSVYTVSLSFEFILSFCFLLCGEKQLKHKRDTYYIILSFFFF